MTHVASVWYKHTLDTSVKWFLSIFTITVLQIQNTNNTSNSNSNRKAETRHTHTYTYGLPESPPLLLL